MLHTSKLVMLGYIGNIDISFRCRYVESYPSLSAASISICSIYRYRWWSGVVVNALASINEVNQRRVRLVPRWVTVSGFNSRCGAFISVCDQLPRSTQPGHPFVGRRNEFQPRTVMPCGWGVKAGVCGWQVKLSDPLVTRKYVSK